MTDLSRRCFIGLLGAFVALARIFPPAVDEPLKALQAPDPVVEKIGTGNFSVETETGTSYGTWEVTSYGVVVESA